MLFSLNPGEFLMQFTELRGRSKGKTHGGVTGAPVPELISDLFILIRRVVIVQDLEPQMNNPSQSAKAFEIF